MTADRLCRICGRPARRGGRHCGARCYRRAVRLGLLANPPPPSPAEIQERCLAIQAAWSDAERVERMRADLRPVAWQLPVVAVAVADVGP